MTRFPFRLFAAFSLACVAPAAAFAAQGFEAEGLAAAIRPTLPLEFEGGIQVVEARAEGALLIVRVTGPAEALRALGPEELSRLFAEGFCRGANAPAIFAAGLRLRMDASGEDGTRIQGEIVDRCPEPRQE